jgi:hypothetical protein
MTRFAENAWGSGNTWVRPNMFKCFVVSFSLWGLAACGGGSAFVASATGGASNSAVGGASSTGGQSGSTAGDTSLGGATSSGGADAGAGGNSGYGALSCADLQTTYSSELAVAETCSTSGPDTCVQTVLDALACGCSAFVSSLRTGALTNLEQIRGVWNNKKCAAGLTCPAVVCVTSTAATCVSTSTTTKVGICTPSNN